MEAVQITHIGGPRQMGAEARGRHGIRLYWR
jgi:hypothetical protein